MGCKYVNFKQIVSLKRIFRIFTALVMSFVAIGTTLSTNVSAQSTLDKLSFVKKIKLAKAGDVEAQLAVAADYELGRNNARKNLLKAARWYRKAAKQGDAKAQFKLARILHTGGRGIKKSPQLAVPLYETAAKQGNANAQYWLGFSYQHGEGLNQITGYIFAV